MGILDKINDKYKGMFIRRGNETFFDGGCQRIPTGIFGLDIITYGGIPAEKITIIWGEYSSSKTTIGYKTIGYAQRLCRGCYKRIDGDECKTDGCRFKGKHKPIRCVLIDVENSYDALWATKCGINIDNLWVLMPSYAEQCVDIINDFIRSDEVDFIMLDSIAHLTPSQEIENSMEKNQQAILARVLNKGWRKWVASMLDIKTDNELRSIPTLFFVNQVREKVGMSYGDPSVMPGGKGQDFAMHMQIRTYPRKYLFDEKTKEPVGRQVMARVTKSKVSPPMEECEFDIFTRDIGVYKAASTNESKEILKHALKYGIINRSPQNKYSFTCRGVDFDWKTQKEIYEQLLSSEECGGELYYDLREHTLKTVVESRLGGASL